MDENELRRQLTERQEQMQLSMLDKRRKNELAELEAAALKKSPTGSRYTPQTHPDEHRSSHLASAITESIRMSRLALVPNDLLDGESDGDEEYHAEILILTPSLVSQKEDLMASIKSLNQDILLSSKKSTERKKLGVKRDEMEACITLDFYQTLTLTLIPNPNSEP